MLPILGLLKKFLILFSGSAWAFVSVDTKLLFQTQANPHVSIFSILFPKSCIELEEICDDYGFQVLESLEFHKEHSSP